MIDNMNANVSNNSAGNGGNVIGFTTAPATDTRDKYADLMIRAKENAMSFEGLRPPNGAWYIGSVKSDSNVYHYYEDEQGNFYYDTQRGREFEQKMQEAEKRQRRRRHSA